MEEVWEQVREFPEYHVSNYGEIRKIKADEGGVGFVDTGVPIELKINQYGNPFVTFHENGRGTNRQLDLLVAETFVPNDWHNPEDFGSTIHLDGDVQNCRADNLMWRPRWFRMKYHKQFHDERTTIKFPIYCLDTDETFPSSLHAAMAYGLLDEDIVLGVFNETTVWPLGYQFRLERP